MKLLKIIVCLHNSKEQSENEIKVIILFEVSFKQMKYLGINLTKETYTKAFKVVLKEIKEHLN